MSMALRVRLAALLLAGTALTAAAHDSGDSTLTTVQRIDRIAEAAVQLVAAAAPDAPDATVRLLPFLTDAGERTRFGHRLRSVVYLRLLRHYRETSVTAAAATPVAESTAADAAAASSAAAFDLEIEIQPFRAVVRLLVKVMHAGGLHSGDWVDLDYSPELRDLLGDAAAAADRSPVPATTRPDPLPGSNGEDPFEPDDVAGAEVVIDPAAATAFTRFLTPGDRDRFSFYLGQPATVVLETTTELDSQLLLYADRDSVPFSVNGDRTGGGGSRLRQELEAGWYVAEVVGFTDQVSGPYRFLLTVDRGDRDRPEAPPADPPGPDPAPRAPPATITAGDTQERHTTAGEDWVELRVREPGFYLLEARSYGAPVDLSLHSDLGQPELVAAATGFSTRIRSVALFVGLSTIYARTATGTGEAIYSLTLSRVDPPRRFTDGAPLSAELEGGVAFHTLRVFRPGSYALTINGSSDAVAVRVFGVPDMHPRPERAHPSGAGVREYQLTSGDYLVELTGARPGARARVCWAPAAAAAQCRA